MTQGGVAEAGTSSMSSFPPSSCQALLWLYHPGKNEDGIAQATPWAWPNEPSERAGISFPKSLLYHLSWGNESSLRLRVIPDSGTLPQHCAQANTLLLRQLWLAEAVCLLPH